MSSSQYSNPHQEMVVLGSIILDHASYLIASEIVKPEFFSSDDTRILAQMIWDLKMLGKPVSPDTLSQNLVHGKNGLQTTLLKAVAISDFSYVHPYCKDIRDSWKNRSYMQLHKEAGRSIDGGQAPTEVYAEVERKRKLIETSDLGGIDHRTIHSIAVECLETSRRIAASDNGMSGISTGINALDRIYRGAPRGETTMIMGDSNMGKTQLTLTFKESFEKQGIPGKYDSIETRATSLTYRDIAAKMKLPISRVKEGLLTDAEWKLYEQIVEEYRGVASYIGDAPAVYIEDWAADTRRMVARHGIEWVIIDYFQLFITREKGNDEAKWSHIINVIKEVAKDCNIAIIIIASMNRSQKTYPYYPELDMIFGSSRIGYNIDHVFGLWRPDYYGIEVDDQGLSYIDRPGFTLIRYLKRRDKDSDIMADEYNIPVQFDTISQRFKDPDWNMTAPALDVPDSHYEKDQEWLSD